MNRDIENPGPDTDASATPDSPASDTASPDPSVPPAGGGQAARGANDNRHNLLDEWDDQVAPIATLRIDASECIAVLFTPEMSRARLHYCDEGEVNGYVHCNEDGCVLCLVGKAVAERALLPVYVPATRSVAVLVISPHSSPGTLRPQLLPILKAGRPMAMAIRKPDRYRYVVNPIELKPGMDDGARIVKAFDALWEAGRVDLTSVYPRFSNRDLASLPGVAQTLAFKEIASDDFD